MITEGRELLERAYAAFNARDIDAALATMDVNGVWPNGMEGGNVYGHSEVREYWLRQWAKIDPHVVPLGFEPDETGRIVVRAHQVIRSLAGEVLKDQIVRHIYTVHGGRITGMEISTP
jgi:hypothetical protein